MTTRLHDAPFALASNGDVLLGVAAFDDAVDLDAALALAKVERGRVFIGVVASPAEVADALDRLAHGFSEAGAYAAGGRQRKTRRGR